MILKSTLKQMRGDRGFYSLFVLNLGLALLGFLILGGFKNSIDRTMMERSRLLLAADLSVSSRRPMSDSEQANLDKEVVDHQGSQILTLEMYSMLSFGPKFKLVELRVIPKEYPFYGQLKFQDGRILKGGDPRPDLQQSGIWVSPELLPQLGVQQTNWVKLGRADLLVSGVVDEDSASSWRGASLAPVVWIDRPSLDRSELFKPGSLVSYRTLIRVPKTMDEKSLEAWVEHLREVLPDPALRVSSHREASEQVSRVLDYLNDYLGLISLIGLMLASLGTAYLYRSDLLKRMNEFGVLAVLGLSRKKIIFGQVLRVFTYVTLATLVAALGAQLLLPRIAVGLKTYLKVPIDFQVQAWDIFLGWAAAIILTVLVCWPFFRLILNRRILDLFREGELGPVSLPESIWVKIRKWIPAEVALFLSATLLTQSWKLGGLFTLGIFLVSAFFLMTFQAVFVLIQNRTHHFKDWRVRTGLRILVRSRVSSLSAGVSIAVAMMLFTLIPQLEKGLRSEFSGSGSELPPSLFMFDIQDDQVDALRRFSKEQKIQIQDLSPMVRAKLVSINSKEAARDDREYSALTREERQEARSKNRIFNLSYREHLAESEKISKGRMYTGRFDPESHKLAEATVEEKFADRLDLSVGDEVRFDVQGVDVDAKIVGLRKVRWTSFSPNFFVTLQPGVLDEAPKTWLAVVPSLSGKLKEDALSKISLEFPNVSAIDVESAVQKLLEIFSQMAFAISVMAGIALCIGFSVLFSIIRHQTQERRFEMGLMKVVGADFKDISMVVAVEFLTILGLSVFLGSLASLVLSALFTVAVFDGTPTFSGVSFFGMFFGSLLLGWIVMKVSSRQALRTKPQVLLNSGG